MAKNGFKTFDSDMHVYDSPDLYKTYMDPKWGERIPVAEGWSKHGRPQFKIGGGTKLRPREKLLDHGEQMVESRYGFALQRNYDAVSQVQAMDMEGLDVAALFRTSPLHCDETFAAEYANDLCRAWNSWIADFCKVDPKRLKASALITLHNVDLALDEVRRAVNELGAVGLSLCPEPVTGSCSMTVISIRCGPRPKTSMLRYVFIRRQAPAANRLRNGSKAIPTIRFW